MINSSGDEEFLEEGVVNTTFGGGSIGEKSPCMNSDNFSADPRQGNMVDLDNGNFKECYDVSNGVGIDWTLLEKGYVGPVDNLKRLVTKGKEHVASKIRKEVRMAFSEVVGQFDLALKEIGSGVMKAHFEGEGSCVGCSSDLNGNFVRHGQHFGGNLGTK